MNESKTEQIVRDKLRGLGYYNDDNTIIDEKPTDDINYRIKDLLKGSSKTDVRGGRGHPDFIISFKADRDLIIVIECKADITKHESKTKDN